MQTFAHPIPQQANGRIVMLSVVGAVHVVLIYALLVTMGYMPVPAVLPPAIFHLIPDKTHPQMPLPEPPLTFAHPTTNNVPKPPPIPIDNGAQAKSGGPIYGGDDVGPQIAPTPLVGIASTHTIPPYPPLDTRLGHEGTVRLKLSIGASGSVSDAVVEKSSGYDGLDAAAVEWVKAHWRYKPATQDGKPVPATSEADVTFRLTRG